jgi:lysophospholipid acyltransferase (LPLAT)-like uncharacterized protein
MTLKDKIFFFIISYIASIFIRFLHLTMNITYINRSEMEDMIKEGKNFIIAFWHGRLLMMPYSYPGKKIHILISHHKDGEYISQTMKRFGFSSVRGSTTRGAFSAVRKLLKVTNEGSDIAITPDGPRGPRHIAQMGVIELAKITSLPILPVTFSVSKKKLYQAGTKC